MGDHANTDVLRLVRHALVRELRPGGQSSRRNRGRSRVRVASICVPSSLAVTDLDPDQAEGLWYGMRSWIDSGIPTAERRRLAVAGAAEDRSGSGGAVVAGAGGGAAVRAGGGWGGRRGGVRRRDAPRARGPVGTVGSRAAAGRPLASGASGRARARRRGGAPREAPAREPRRRRTGTKPRLVSIFRQGLAGWMSVLIAGPASPKPTMEAQKLGGKYGARSRRRPTSPRLRSPKTPPSERRGEIGDNQSPKSASSYPPPVKQYIKYT